MNAPEEQPMLPPEAMPANTPEGQSVTGPPIPEANVQGQTLIQEGEASNRIVTTREL